MVEKDRRRSFLILPPLTSRKRDIVPRQHLGYITNMTFVSNDAVLVRYDDYKTVHYKTDGTVIYQEDDEVSKLLKSRVHIIAESEIINDTKYVLIFDYGSYNNSVLLYDETGNAKMIGKAIDSKITN